MFSDALGSTVALTKASGQFTEKHAYTAYGLETIAGPGHAAFRFAGRRLDPETGLYHNRARASREQMMATYVLFANREESSCVTASHKLDSISLRANQSISAGSMATVFNSPFIGYSFAATAMKEILDHPIEGETASARMKQIGFLCFVHQLQLAGAETTFTNIMAITGLQRTSVVEFVAPLVERDLLIEQQVKNTAGRGRATKLMIPPVFLSRIQPVA